MRPNRTAQAMLQAVSLSSFVCIFLFLRRFRLGKSAAHWDRDSELQKHFIWWSRQLAYIHRPTLQSRSQRWWLVLRREI